MELRNLELYLGEIDPEVDGLPLVGTADRDACMKAMQEHLLAHEADFTTDFEINGEKLTLELHRHGKAFAAIWTASGQEIGFTVLLRGKDGADDLAAMQTIRDHQPSFDIDTKTWNQIIAHNRPVFVDAYYDPDWFRSGRMQLVGSGLTLAYLNPTGKPSMEVRKEMTPEEIELDKQSAERISDVFMVIQNDWADRGKLRYDVIAMERIKGRPIDEIMDARFNVGVGSKLTSLNIHELVSVFIMLRDHKEQAPGMKHLKKQRLNFSVKTRHEPAFLAAVLKQIAAEASRLNASVSARSGMRRSREALRFGGRGFPTSRSIALAASCGVSSKLSSPLARASSFSAITSMGTETPTMFFKTS